tara:strand:+ start:106 stop:237 length:132 start_codon:yes stop_codon:yes gene_type:complete
LDIILALDVAVIAVSEPDKNPDNITRNIREKSKIMVKIDINLI